MFVALPVLCIATLSACTERPPAGGTVNIEITHVFGDAPLSLEDSVYETTSGDALRISRLRYYLSNLRLRNADGSWFTYPLGTTQPSGYFLIDAAKPGSLHLALAHVPPGQYEGLEFLIGIDEARNDQGAQSGALDPAHGMFWSWSSGYIFFLLEGHGAAGNDPTSQPATSFEYHVGGRSTPSLTRSVYLPMGERPLQVKPEVIGTIHLMADVAEVFDQPTRIRIAELSTAMDATGGAIVADNYADIFRVDHLHHEPVR